MASMSKEGPKRYRIQFMDVTGNGKRQRLRLHNVTKRQAEDVLRYVENIASARRQGVALNDADAAWLGSLSDSFHDLLVSKGLADPRPELEAEPEPDLLGEFLDEFIRIGRTKDGEEASTATKRKWKLVAARLKDFFGEGRELDSFTPDDGYRFREYLNDKPLVLRKVKQDRGPLDENTVRKNIGICKTFFNNAKRRRKIAANPFEHEVSEVKENRNRDFDVKAEIADRIIEACPDNQWKLLVALWRYAGLRKTEPLHLTWGDILWDQGRMRVVCSKTARHEGKDIRYVPIRDVRKYLDAVYFEAADGDERIITRFAPSNSNLDKPLKKIMHQAGVVPWPKLFNNMRASCETAWLDEGHPAHVVAAWIGHSVKVQRKHYAQITDDHFDRFNSRENVSGGGAHSGAHSGAELVGTEENPTE